MKKLLTAATAAALPLVLLLAGCTSEQAAAPAETDGDTSSVTTEIPGVFSGSDTVPDALGEDLDVALVTRITTGSWYETYAKEVESEVDALGGTLQVYDSSNDLSKMASNVDAAVNAGVDILLINNGTAEALDTSVQKALDADIPVVAYDSDIILDGVSSINQDDAALATNGLTALGEDFDENANIVVLSVAGFAPLDRRLAAVDSYVAENPGVTIASQTGTVSGSASLDTAAQVSALLKADPYGIDAIWSNWNEFTRGAFTALQEADRSDIAVYSVDLTDQELPYFWDDTVDFRAASATNPATIGRSQVRLGWVKAAGEDAEDLSVAPVLILKSDLPDTEISYDELGDTVPAWNADETEWPAWIKTLQQSK